MPRSSPSARSSRSSRSRPARHRPHRTSLRMPSSSRRSSSSTSRWSSSGSCISPSTRSPTGSGVSATSPRDLRSFRARHRPVGPHRRRGRPGELIRTAKHHDGFALWPLAGSGVWWDEHRSQRHGGGGEDTGDDRGRHFRMIRRLWTRRSRSLLRLRVLISSISRR